MHELVDFIPLSQYSDKLSKAFLLLKEHPKDADFLALALKLNASIVSNDSELLKQTVVEVYNKPKFSILF